MKIFISCSPMDRDSCADLAIILNNQKNSVFYVDHFCNRRSILEEVRAAIHKSDIIIAIITEGFLVSPLAQAELSSAIFSANDMRVLPIIVGDAFLPSYLMGYPYRKVETKEGITDAVLSYLAQLENPTTFQNETIINNGENDIEGKISLLREALIDNQLTLVCGAGVSSGSAIPTWNELLISILNEDCFDCLNGRDSNAESRVEAEAILSLMPKSNLILGKYIKLLLMANFDKTVQKHLYKYYNFPYEFEPINPNLETSMMKAIVELSRPKRRGNRLESIISFNFDDLLECALTYHHIEHCSIWKEGQTHGIDELPIYHVHGFLPNKKDFEEPNLVFSEEAYHSQFIDPYSWSNLIQLNTFSTNVCLFVGISLSDPNLRRLLDISWRRNQRCKHYIIMKQSPQKSRTDKIVTMLFEQDANSLGLNVIWCSDYSEIPDILCKIAK